MLIFIESKTEEIDVKVKDIDINVNRCDENQIKIYKNKSKDIYLCENPICKEDCPINESATCKKFTTEDSTNDINKNVCVCNPGWNGTNCMEKIFIDYRYFIY